jgi:putative SOS response-associated peptidase YedK
MYTWEELIRLYRLTLPNISTNLRPRYNICPTDAVAEKDGNHGLEPMRWGLVPKWWSSKK